MFRNRLYLTVILVLLCISSQALCQEKPEEQTPAPVKELPPLVSPETLKNARLTILWQSKVAMEPTERLQQLFIRGDTIYALTDQNYLFGINKDNGRIRFGKLIAAAGFSVPEPQLFNDDLYFTVGNSLIQIDTDFGGVVRSTHFDFTVTTPVVRNEQFVYVAGNDRRLHVFDSNSMLEEFEVSADNSSSVTSVVADNRNVIFATDRGNVICCEPDKPVRRWQFNTAGAKPSTLVVDGENLLVSGQDTNVYRVNAKTGGMKWKFHTGAKVLGPARVTEHAVYQDARYYGLYALEKETGRQIWRLSGGRDLLTEKYDKAYVIAENGSLVVMSNQTDEELYSSGPGDISVYVADDRESLIYVGDHRGRITCLKPEK